LTCAQVTAETTRAVVSEARGLFQAHGFHSAYKDLEAARTSIRDGDFETTITRSLAALESVQRHCHDEFGQALPNKKQATDLWKSTRGLLKFDEIGEDEKVAALLNSLHGLNVNLAAVRNSLSSAHGKGKFPPLVSEALAELALNTSCALATMVIRRYLQLAADERP
jgi:hypothetical protein